MSKTKNTRDEWREWLGSHGLPHNEVEGDMILDFIEAIVTQTKQETIQACIDALPEVVGDSKNNPPNGSSNHSFRLGFNQAIDQAHTALNKLGEQE